MSSSSDRTPEMLVLNGDSALVAREQLKPRFSDLTDDWLWLRQWQHFTLPSRSPPLFRSQTNSAEPLMRWFKVNKAALYRLYMHRAVACRIFSWLFGANGAREIPFHASANSQMFVRDTGGLACLKFRHTKCRGAGNCSHDFLMSISCDPALPSL